MTDGFDHAPPLAGFNSYRAKEFTTKHDACFRRPHMPLECRYCGSRYDGQKWVRLHMGELVLVPECYEHGIGDPVDVSRLR